MIERISLLSVGCSVFGPKGSATEGKVCASCFRITGPDSIILH
jgi:hypothetical protein